MSFIKEYFNHCYRYKVSICPPNIHSWIYYADDNSIVFAFYQLKLRENIVSSSRGGVSSSFVVGSDLKGGKGL